MMNFQRVLWKIVVVSMVACSIDLQKIATFRRSTTSVAREKKQNDLVASMWRSQIELY
jgi:hypothetical protein